LYLSLLPQFIRPVRETILVQGLVLGATQIVISAAINSLIILVAGTIASFLANRPTWRRTQRWLMAGVLTSLALKMATEARR
jgi:threonine/homoserine/homoserine lactone efflux protein